MITERIIFVSRGITVLRSGLLVKQVRVCPQSVTIPALLFCYFSPYFIFLTSLKKNAGDSSLLHSPVQVYIQNFSPYLSKELAIRYTTGWGVCVCVWDNDRKRFLRLDGYLFLRLHHYLSQLRTPITARYQMYVTLILSDFNQKWNLSTNFTENNKYGL